MKMLGIDYGKARIGVAVSDESGLIATPLSVVGCTCIEADLSRIAELASQHEVDAVVVGMPLQLDGTPGLAAKAVQQFVDLLSERIDVPVEIWDERLSTAQAERAMIAADTSRKRRRERLDAVAAQMILQSYLDARRARG